MTKFVLFTMKSLTLSYSVLTLVLTLLVTYFCISSASETTPGPEKSSKSQSTTNQTGNNVTSLEGILNRTHLSDSCKTLEFGCFASDWPLPICGSNGQVYLNPGVLICAQVCQPEIELEFFCELIPSDPEESKTCKKCAEKITAMKANEGKNEDAGGEQPQEQPPMGMEGQGPPDGNFPPGLGQEGPPPETNWGSESGTATNDTTATAGDPPPVDPVASNSIDNSNSTV